MIKWAEVHTLGEGLSNPSVKLAALIVSDEPDGGLATMASLKETYGSTAIYRWHSCNHDDKQSCFVEPA